MDLNALILVASAGALGALARFGIGELGRRRLGVSGWVAILAANLLGCLALGWLVAALATGADPLATGRWHAFLVAGFCGSLTTFSSFALDLSLLWRQRRFAEWALDLGLTAAGGVAAVWLGLLLGAGR